MYVSRFGHREFLGLCIQRSGKSGRSGQRGALTRVRICQGDVCTFEVEPPDPAETRALGQDQKALTEMPRLVDPTVAAAVDVVCLGSDAAWLNDIDCPVSALRQCSSVDDTAKKGSAFPKIDDTRCGAEMGLFFEACPFFVRPYWIQRRKRHRLETSRPHCSRAGVQVVLLELFFTLRDDMHRSPAADHGSKEQRDDDDWMFHASGNAHLLITLHANQRLSSGNALGMRNHVDRPRVVPGQRLEPGFDDVHDPGEPPRRTNSQVEPLETLWSALETRPKRTILARKNAQHKSTTDRKTRTRLKNPYQVEPLETL